MAQQKNKPSELTDILPTEEYHAIESAVLETARGRWFLEEYARRHRVADTEILLEAIARLENSIGGAPAKPAADAAPIADAPVATVIAEPRHVVPPNAGENETLQRLHLEVAELSAAIQLTRQEISELGSQQAQNGGFAPAANEMDDIFEHTEKAISDILQAAEAMQASAWAAREDGTDTEVCDRLDKCAINIYTACTFQELTGQRIAKLLSLIEFTESHVVRMLQHWQVDDETDAPDAEVVGAPTQTEKLVEDTRPADVFEASPMHDDGQREPESNAFQQLSEDGDVHGDVLSGNNPFEGQDAFVSTEETLKSVAQS
ncbi:hypothetical protein [Pararhizobium sp. IMCC21322]|uniref:hypothetical protein n=1 Tax=Pararhizobium sp. IMCC21322 TaxID=3067903 RepID=UPI002740428F|nr:hypothetical protein [Pararhizobium sp. IMCC21322]